MVLREMHFDATLPHHCRLADLAKDGEAIAADINLPPDVGFQAARRKVREAISEAGLAKRLDEAVAELLRTKLR